MWSVWKHSSSPLEPVPRAPDLERMRRTTKVVLLNLRQKKEHIDMRNLKPLAGLVAVACFMFVVTAGAFAQNSDNSRPVQVPQGTKQKIQGVVSSRTGDEF